MGVQSVMDSVNVAAGQLMAAPAPIEDIDDASSALEAIPFLQPLLIIIAVLFMVWMILKSLGDFGGGKWGKAFQKLAAGLIVLTIALFPAILFGFVDIFASIFQAIGDLFTSS